VRDHSRHIQADREEALRIITAHCPVMKETELVPVKDAVGRVLAEDALSQWDSPNVLTCALDSIAVHWDDFAEGMPDTSGWIRGRDWTFANTGTAMPAGFDAAVVVEQAEFSHLCIFCSRPSVICIRIDAYTASWSKDTCYLYVFGIHKFYQILHNLVHAILMEITMIAETEKIQFQTLALHHFFIRQIADAYLSKVWLPSYGTKTGEFRAVKPDPIVVLRVFILECL
jgi:sulfur relay (sulfurtransferase) DsrF/TusC family protein